MFGYQFSCTVSDSVFGSAHRVITVDAASPAEALSLVKQELGLIEVNALLGSIDREPQVFLAW